MPKLPYEYVEVLGVEGECAEDHVKEAAPYAGRLNHVRSLKTGNYMAFGYVTLPNAVHFRGLTSGPFDPYRYEPPYTIGFPDLTPDNLQGDLLQLAGVSEYLADEESRRPRYRATCTLRVIERQSHRPAWQEDTRQ